MDTRQCKRCKTIKSVEDFYKWRKYICKECENKKDREEYPETVEYHRAYWKKWYKKHKEEHSINSRRWSIAWQKNHKEEHNAMSLLRYHLRSGNIKKGTNCSICNKRTKLEAHHRDYKRALEVIWLCRSCHKLIHQRILTKALENVE